MSYALIEVRTPEDWAAFHDIRRTELFEARGRYGVYDDKHPDDVADCAHPFLLKHNGRPLGTTRLDVRGDGTGIFRLVAITADAQGQGHGRVLSEMVEAKARSFGIGTLYVNAADTAVGFYEKTGWTHFLWDEAELVGIASTCVQMRKLL
jgi:N-acetylglutamate synthase-like GNAT family acetyltransferase